MPSPPRPKMQFAVVWVTMPAGNPKGVGRRARLVPRATSHPSLTLPFRLCSLTFCLPQQIFQCIIGAHCCLFLHFYRSVSLLILRMPDPVSPGPKSRSKSFPLVFDGLLTHGLHIGLLRRSTGLRLVMLRSLNSARPSRLAQISKSLLFLRVN